MELYIVPATNPQIAGHMTMLMTVDEIHVSQKPVFREHRLGCQHYRETFLY
jgi:hypothetical protein